MNKSRNELSQKWLEENPCYQCDDRSPVCHGVCEAYEKSKQIRKQIKEKIRIQKLNEDEARKELIGKYAGKRYF